jgi:hypothetical protein
MKYSTLIEDMITEGATPEMILVAVRAVERQETDALERRRAADRARQDRHRVSVSRDTTLRNVSHGLSRSHVGAEDKTSTSEIEPLKEESKKVARGTRLPSDFVLPNEWFQWALQRGLPAHRIPVEFEKLTNWAANAPTSKAVKANWFKAWQNWVIGAIDALPQNRAPPASQQAPSMSQLLTVIRDHPNENQPGPPEDRSGFRSAIPHLRTVGAG